MGSITRLEHIQEKGTDEACFEDVMNTALEIRQYKQDLCTSFINESPSLK